MAELEVEAGRRLRNIAQFSFARGGQAIDPESLAAFEKGRLGAKQLAKQKSLSEARKAKFEQETLAETKRASEARELLGTQQLEESKRASQALEAQQAIQLQIDRQRADEAAKSARKAAQAAEPTFIEGLFGK